MSIMLSNPADRKKIREALQEISNSMTRIEGERDYIKEPSGAWRRFIIPKTSRKK
jgi:hypothetical protein